MSLADWIILADLLIVTALVGARIAKELRTGAPAPSASPEPTRANVAPPSGDLRAPGAPPPRGP